MAELLDAPVDRPLGPEDGRTNLIVNYLPQSLTDDEFNQIFTRCGPLNSAKIIRTPGSGYSHGYGFINYQQSDDAAKAVLELNGFQLQNKRLKVSYSRPNCDNIKDTNLYVANLGSDITEDKLKEMFDPYGKILTMKLLMDPSGRARGTAFIRFNKKQEAAEALNGENGKTTMPGAQHAIHVKIAEDQGKQKADQFGGGGGGGGGNHYQQQQQGFNPYQQQQQMGFAAGYGGLGGGYASGGYGGPQRYGGNGGGDRFNPMQGRGGNGGGRGGGNKFNNYGGGDNGASGGGGAGGGYHTQEFGFYQQQPEQQQQQGGGGGRGGRGRGRGRGDFNNGGGFGTWDQNAANNVWQ